jgi:hypothetical protein
MQVSKQWAFGHILIFRRGQDVTIRHTTFGCDSNSFEMDGQYITFVTPEYCPFRDIEE